MKMYVVEEANLIEAEHGDGTYVYKADDVDTRIAELRSARMTAGERLAVIEECARALDAAADDFVAMGNDYDEGEERDHAYSMAHVFDIAADEIRRMNPQFAAAERRNQERVKAWVQKAKETGDWSNLPQVESPRQKDN